MTRAILAGDDGSPGAGAAVSWAEGLAAAVGGDVSVATVDSETGTSATAGLLVEARALALSPCPTVVIPADLAVGGSPHAR